MAFLHVFRWATITLVAALYLLCEHPAEAIRVRSPIPRGATTAGLHSPDSRGVSSRADPSGYVLSGSSITPNKLLRAILTSDAESMQVDAGSPVSERSGLGCLACRGAVDVLLEIIQSNRTEGAIIDLLVNECISRKLQAPIVCKGIIPEFQDVFFAVFTREFSSERLCAAFHACPEPLLPVGSTIHFPKPRPPPQAPIHPTPGSPTYTVAHLSDIHWDNLYVDGTLTACGLPLCCREANGPGGKNTSAGPFGDYQCDTNAKLLHSMLSDLAKRNPTYVTYTGDSPPHDVWEQSQQKQLNASLRLSTAMQTYLPNTIPVFMSIGNHESFPVNEFGPAPTMSWLFDNLAEYWKPWLDANSTQTLKSSGYYVKEANKGLQVISLNMNYCNNLNFWLLLNDTDPYNMLQWFIDTLQAAEDYGDKVIVLGHIPLSSADCLLTWASNYYQIIERYNETIALHLYGHTHKDEFEVWYDRETMSNPVSVSYVAPSLTPNGFRNPSYRIYEVQVEGNIPVDHMTYHAILPTANSANNATWVLEYTARSAYDMPYIDAQSWNTVLSQIRENATVALKYLTYYNSGYPYGKPCDARCRAKTADRIQMVRFNSTLGPDPHARRDTHAGSRPWIPTHTTDSSSPRGNSSSSSFTTVHPDDL